MARWIWKFGDFEKYHNIRVHTRRQNYGYLEAPVWKLYAPDPVVRFRKKVRTEGGRIRVAAQGEFTVSLLGEQFFHGEKKLWGAPEAELPAGEYLLQIRVMNTQSFPALFVSGLEECESGPAWEADDTSGNFAAAGSSGLFEDPEKLPEVFPFEETKVEPVLTGQISDGAGAEAVLFDFGKELFARVELSGFGPDCGAVRIRLGESEEEACSTEAVIQFCRKPENSRIILPDSALRFLWVELPAPQKQETVRAAAFLKLLPEARCASFTCNEPAINDVWKTAEYTFRLNCREFFLDGIKRDGWVWSADTYQSLFVDRYLYMDQELEKRTLTALGGGLPVVQYINTIMDYSYFWLMSLRDYYRTYGDADYLRAIYPQAAAVMQFCQARRSPDGFIRGREGDWVFIDWAPMDKTGALCGEQILLAEAMEAFGEIEDALTESDKTLNSGDFPEKRTDWRQEAAALRSQILTRFYDEEPGVFVDSYESGKRNVSRQSNILAYLYLGVSEKIRHQIYERVVCNPDVTPITTPYFKFYENQVHCEEGNLSLLEESLRDYYGSMLALGATTLYEQYDPSQTGAEHYAMYGRPFEKSLCHAWSCSPIYLLGRYRLGVVSTGIAYETFEVRPQAGDLKEFEGTVPLPRGEVRVELGHTEDGKECVKVCAAAAGGTLVYGGQRVTLPAGEEITVIREA